MSQKMIKAANTEKERERGGEQERERRGEQERETGH